MFNEGDVPESSGTSRQAITTTARGSIVGEARTFRSRSTNRRAAAAMLAGLVLLAVVVALATRVG